MLLAVLFNVLSAFGVTVDELFLSVLALKESSSLLAPSLIDPFSDSLSLSVPST